MSRSFFLFLSLLSHIYKRICSVFLVDIFSFKNLLISIYFLNFVAEHH